MQKEQAAYNTPEQSASEEVHPARQQLWTTMHRIVLGHGKAAPHAEHRNPTKHGCTNGPDSQRPPQTDIREECVHKEREYETYDAK